MSQAMTAEPTPLSREEFADLMAGLWSAPMSRILATISVGFATIDALTDQVAKVETDADMARADFNDCNAERQRWKDRAEAAEAERDALKVERDGLREAGDAMHETLAQYVRELVSGHTILYKPDPDYGKIDPEVREEIEGYQRDLARWAALSPPKEGGDAEGE